MAACSAPGGWRQQRRMHDGAAPEQPAQLCGQPLHSLQAAPCLPPSLTPLPFPLCPACSLSSWIWMRSSATATAPCWSEKEPQTEPQMLTAWTLKAECCRCAGGGPT